MWKAIRITALLIVLGAVAAQAWLDRSTTTDWKNSLWVGIFPLNADGSAAAERYIAGLTQRDYSDIEEFFARESDRYGLALTRPVRIELYPPADRLPPTLEPGAGPLETAWWSLKLRWFTMRAADVPGRTPAQIRMFVLYHDPQRQERVPHSHGLQKGLVGVVHAFADRGMARQNSIVIAHEVLHTLGASDKYDLATGAPLFPDGFADPQAQPLHPQRRAEIMAGRRALSPIEHEMPASLREAVIGPATAAEIQWIRH